MKKYFVTPICFLLISTFVYADQFQFVYDRDGERFNVAYASVKITDSSKTVLHSGSTDKFGRITIELADGSYNCEVVYRNKPWSVRLTFDAHDGIKIVPIT